MKKSTKTKITQTVFNYISDGYKIGEKNFNRDVIVNKIESDPKLGKLSRKAIEREVDRQLLFFCKLGILEKPKPSDSSAYSLSELAPTILIEDEKSTSIDDNLYKLAEAINDRQYRMYSWYTTKFQNLLSVGSFLFAGIVLLITSFCSLKCMSINWFSIIYFITTGVSLLTLALSVGFGLCNLIPKLSSKIGGNEDNIRTLIGMQRFLTLQSKLGKNEEGNDFYPVSFHYYDDFRNLSYEQKLKYTVMQCIGMGKNNLESELQLRIASILMIIAFATGIVRHKVVEPKRFWRRLCIRYCKTLNQRIA